MVKEGAFRLLYVAPERFDASIARSADVKTHQKLRPSFLIIDEAHLIDQWGMDFRPSYARLAKVRRSLGDPPVLAFTATAGKERQERIKESLGIADAKTLVSGTDRPNITLLRIPRPASVRTADEWMAERARMVAGLSEGLSSGRGLVFVPTVNMGRQLQEELTRLGVELEIYHGKLNAEERGKLTEDFLDDSGDRAPVLITTSAFSLGIDISDIRLVVHLQHPSSVEEYLQEFGRAGRDRRPATAVLFSDPKTDSGLLEWMANRTVDEAVDEKKMSPKQAEEVKKIRKAERDLMGRLAVLGLDEAFDPRGMARSERNSSSRQSLCFRAALGDALGVMTEDEKDPLTVRMIQWLLDSKEEVESGRGCCDLCNPELAEMVREAGFDAADRGQQ